ALSLDRERRPDVLRLRLGVDAARSRVLRGVPRPGLDDRAARPGPGAALDAIPRRARRRADQAAPRPLLARPDLPLLPPRDAADAEPADRALPRAAADRAARERGVQPLRATRRAVRAVRAAADRGGRRGLHHRPPARADRERKLLLAQLAHRDPGIHRLLG